MQKFLSVRFAYLLSVLAIVPLTLGCASEAITEEAMPLIGSWDATTLVVDGDDLVGQGASISFTFVEDGSYSFSVNNEPGGFLCEPPPNCFDEGDFEATAGTIVLDPGTADEVSLSYSVSGNALTFSGTFFGSSISGTFQKVL